LWHEKFTQGDNRAMQNVMRHAWIDRIRRIPRAVAAALLFVAAAAIAAPADATGDASSGAFSFIQGLGNDAIKELTDRAIARPEREARFRRLLNDHFDVAAISKFVLGRYWRTATDAERADFQKLFEDYIVQSYAVRFGEYSGERFEVTGSSNDVEGVVVVHSKIDRAAAEDVRLDWRLHPAGSDFAIVDIVVEGVSMAVTQRSEFASVIQSKGGTVKGLIDALRAKTTQSANAVPQ